MQQVGSMPRAAVGFARMPRCHCRQPSLPATIEGVLVIALGSNRWTRREHRKTIRSAKISSTEYAKVRIHDLLRLNGFTDNVPGIASTVDLPATVGETSDAGDSSQCGRLASSVGTKHPEDRTCQNIEGQVLDRQSVAVSLVVIVNRNNSVGVHGRFQVPSFAE